MDAILTFLRDGGPGLAALITVLGVLGTIFATNRGNKARLQHEEKMKELELEVAEKARLRDERIAAYRTILSASTVFPKNRKNVQELGQVVAEILLVAETKEVSDAARNLFEAYRASHEQIAANAADPTEEKAPEQEEGMVQVTSRRWLFLELARKELGVDD